MTDPQPRSEPRASGVRRFLFQRPTTVGEAIRNRFFIALVLLPAVAALYGMSRHGFAVGALWAVMQLVIGIPFDVVRIRRWQS